MEQLTKEQAKAFADNELYKGWSYRQIAEFQLAQDRLCMPFEVFHEAMEKTLGRPVFTHEFAIADNLRKELYGEKEPPTFDEVLSLIPKEKRILIIG